MKKPLWIMCLVMVLVVFAACENPLLPTIQQILKTANSQQWDSLATYSVNQYVLMPPLTNGGPIYKSLQGGNLSHNPLTEPAWWVLDDTQRY
jgi:hypothetical protein